MTDSQQTLPANFAHTDPLAAGQNDGALTSAFAEDLRDSTCIHNGGAMDPYELSRIERLSKIFDGFADHVTLWTDVETGVVVCCLDPVNIIDGNENVFVSVRHENPFRVFRVRREEVLKPREHRLPLLRVIQRRAGCDALFDARQRRLKARQLDGFGQVIQCVDLESLNGILVVRGHEDRRRSPLSVDLFHDFEPAPDGHLNIQEEHIKCGVVERGDDIFAIAAFGGD